jgi:ubiquinone/menaquinone biosynthesis C-methylase UbiE
MRRIAIRAPACGADIITYLKRVFRIHAEELQPGDQVEFVFDAERFPFADAIFKSLMAAAGLRMITARAEDGTRIVAAERG